MQTEGEICRPLIAVCGNYDCAHGAASLCCAKGRAVLCKQTEGGICRPLVAVCGKYNCAHGAASFCCAKGRAVLCKQTEGKILMSNG